MTDFVALSRAARDLPGPDTHDRLWAAWFELPAWHFIRATSPSGWLPFSAFVHGVRCVLGFTAGNGADGYARMTGLTHPNISPALTLLPDAFLQLVPHLRMYGVQGIVVDTGADGFYTPIDSLFGMYRRYRPAPVGMMQPQPPPPPQPLRMQPPQPMPAPILTVDSLLALPAWHVVTTKADPTFPDLATRGTDLIAQIYSSPQALARFAGTPSPPTTVMPPQRVLTWLVDMELVHAVRFDAQLEVELVDLKLRGAT